MTALVKYDAMVKAIAVAYKVDEVKKIRDQAAALEHYARLAKNTENERRACEIRLRAERKAGQLLKKSKPRKAAGRPSKNKSRSATNLKAKGVSRDQSSKWQKLADVPEERFEAALGQAEMPTTAGIIKATAEPKINPVADDALWLWGRLKDFERDGLLTKDPADVMSTMTSKMRDDVHTLAPRVAAWLRRIGAIDGAETHQQERCIA